MKPTMFSPSHLSSQRAESLRLGWIKLLSQVEWDLFVHLTFRYEQRNETWVKQIFEEWLNRCYLDYAIRVGSMTEVTTILHDDEGVPYDQLDRSGPFWNAWRKGLLRPAWACAIERHASGALHVHALVAHRAFAGEIQSVDFYRNWINYSPASGRAEIEPPRNQADVIGYITKDVATSTEIFVSPKATRGTR